MKSEIYDYIVEWDDAKNEININKHGISFETAAYIFMMLTGQSTLMKNIAKARIDIIQLEKQRMFCLLYIRNEVLRYA